MAVEYFLFVIKLPQAQACPGPSGQDSSASSKDMAAVSKTATKGNERKQENGDTKESKKPNQLGIDKTIFAV